MGNFEMKIVRKKGCKGFNVKCESIENKWDQFVKRREGRGCPVSMKCSPGGSKKQNTPPAYFDLIYHELLNTPLLTLAMALQLSEKAVELI